MDELYCGTKKMLSKKHLKRLPTKNEFESESEKLNDKEDLHMGFESETFGDTDEDDMEFVNCEMEPHSSSSKMFDPPKKIRKSNINKEQQAKNCLPQCGCENRIMRLEETIKSQTEVFVRHFREQKSLITQLLRERGGGALISSKFPISTEGDLRRINNEIKEGNKEAYVQVLKTLLLPHGIIKNLKYVLSDELANSYNVDGVAGRRCLKAHQHFYETLIASIPFEIERTPLEQLRKAMQLAKKRVSKRKDDK